MPEDSEIAADDAPSAQAREVEVKLTGPDALLRRAFALAPFAGVRAGRRRTLETTYFDTESGALGAAGMALRLRRVGTKRTITLKWVEHAQTGVFERGEQEAPAHGDDLQITLLGPACEAMILGATGGAPLVARSATRFTRRVALVEAMGARIEAALDEGAIIVGDRTAPIDELELELKGGDPAGLYGFAGSLVDHGLRIAPAAKGLRGRWLATGEAPRETRVAPPELAPDATLDAVIAAAIEANVAAFVANWPALSPDCPEAVHQMRVALRRLRAALALFQRALPHPEFQRLRAEAKRIAGDLGPARDLDVLTAMVEGGPAAALGRDASFEALLSVAAVRREAAYRQARALLETPEASRFALDALAFAAARGWSAQADPEVSAAPATTFAAAALERLDKRARKRGKHLVEQPPEARHEARIALKNLRYAADLSAPLFGRGRGARRFARAVAGLQDALGAYNDAVVARSLTSDLESEAGAVAARAGGAVSGWTARGAVDADEGLASAWKAFRKAPRFWR